MSISIGTDSLYNATLNNSNKTNKLENSLSNKIEDSTDEELMEVCKSFESYLLEQVFKKMESTITKTEEDGEYVSYFKDMMYQNYAEDATDTQGFGIAQMLYESMKRNQ
ncbi:flagellar protein FlgJ [Mobilisporobacter senegalensis]|uniref:Flagellar protein FlgJ n=1 Tax=Mobilisporobacter senegalensis TaxID=1329262 RepID=A0A3N1X7E5_9FIRM|nr:rod-binding protein [Mobilisporobacter senegalensis]ROR21951.1 flagellar protein FlgJ [Mobilisporobacter senegalensis]